MCSIVRSLLTYLLLRQGASLGPEAPSAEIGALVALSLCTGLPHPDPLMSELETRKRWTTVAAGMFSRRNPTPQDNLSRRLVERVCHLGIGVTNKARVRIWILSD